MTEFADSEEKVERALFAIQTTPDREELRSCDRADRKTFLVVTLYLHEVFEGRRPRKKGLCFGRWDLDRRLQQTGCALLLRW